MNNFYKTAFLTVVFIFLLVSCSDEESVKNEDIILNIKVSHLGPHIYQIEFLPKNTHAAENLEKVLSDANVRAILEAAESYSLKLPENDSTGNEILSADLDILNKTVRLELKNDLTPSSKNTFSIKSFTYTDTNDHKSEFNLSIEYTFNYVDGVEYTVNAQSNIFVGNVEEKDASLDGVTLNGVYPQRINVPSDAEWASFRIKKITIDSVVGDFKTPAGGHLGATDDTGFTKKDENNIAYSTMIRKGNDDIDDIIHWYLAGVFINTKSYAESYSGGNTEFKTNYDPDPNKIYYTTEEDYTNTLKQKSFYIGSGRKIFDEFEGEDIPLLEEDFLKKQIFDSSTDSLRYFKIPSTSGGDKIDVLYLGIQDEPVSFDDNGKSSIDVEVNFYNDGYKP